MTAPVVLVPGLGLGPEAYAPTLRHLEARCDVVTLPGYGKKATKDVDLHTEALADLLAAELAGRQTEPSVLVGHSASCQIVVETALRHPDLVKALVLIGPSGDLRASSWPILAGRWARSALWDPPTLVPTLARQYLRTGLASIARTIEAARRYDLAAAACRLTVPTVIVRSAHDRLAPAPWIQEVAELTGGEAWTLPTGSHLPVLTNGRDLAAFIKRAAGVYNAG